MTCAWVTSPMPIARIAHPSWTHRGAVLSIETGGAALIEGQTLIGAACFTSIPAVDAVEIGRSADAVMAHAISTNPSPVANLPCGHGCWARNVTRGRLKGAIALVTQGPDVVPKRGGGVTRTHSTDRVTGAVIATRGGRPTGALAVAGDSIVSGVADAAAIACEARVAGPVAARTACGLTARAVSSRIADGTRAIDKTVGRPVATALVRRHARTGISAGLVVEYGAWQIAPRSTPAEGTTAHHRS